jgi:sugar phosphate permease
MLAHSVRIIGTLCMHVYANVYAWYIHPAIAMPPCVHVVVSFWVYVQVCSQPINYGLRTKKKEKKEKEDHPKKKKKKNKEKKKKEQEDHRAMMRMFVCVGNACMYA